MIEIFFMRVFQSVLQKSFLQDVRHNLWGFDQDEVVVANYGSQIQEKYTVK